MADFEEGESYVIDDLPDNEMNESGKLEWVADNTLALAHDGMVVESVGISRPEQYSSGLSDSSRTWLSPLPGCNAACAVSATFEWYSVRCTDVKYLTDDGELREEPLEDEARESEDAS